MGHSLGVPCPLDASRHISVTFETQICLPVEGMIMNCVAKNITKAGIKGEIDKLHDNPLIIYVMRDHFNLRNILQVHVHN